MTIWRPPAEIRVKVIGLVVHDRTLLVMEVPDDKGRIKGVRPPGGTVELGETREHALAREFKEEFDSEISQTGPWMIFENIYRHEGVIGHEYLFACPVTLKREILYEQARMEIPNEGFASWYTIKDLLSGDVTLYPPQLCDCAYLQEKADF